MLKLKDIFNIDIPSKGGGKLYKKIMRKYNIPLKDVKEVKQEIVECSSGGGENTGGGSSDDKTVEFIYVKLNGQSPFTNVSYFVTGFIPVYFRGKTSITPSASTNDAISSGYMNKMYGVEFLGIAFLNRKKDGTKITFDDIVGSNYKISTWEEITEEEFNNLN